MTHAELFQLLESTGLPVAHNDFKNSPSLPYVVYKEAEASGRGGDEKNLLRDSGWLVELYTDSGDPDYQKLVEDLLDARGIEWIMTFNGLIESEGIYMTAYAFATVRKIRRT